MSGVFSRFFGPNRKVSWNVRTSLTIYKNGTRHCYMKANYLLPARKNNYKVHKMIADKKKTSNISFLFDQDSPGYPYRTGLLTLSENTPIYREIDRKLDR